MIWKMIIEHMNAKQVLYFQYNTSSLGPDEDSIGGEMTLNKRVISI